MRLAVQVEHTSIWGNFKVFLGMLGHLANILFALFLLLFLLWNIQGEGHGLWECTQGYDNLRAYYLYLHNSEESLDGSSSLALMTNS